MVVVCLYTEFESFIEGGIAQSIQQQRKALEHVGVPFTEDPSKDFDVLHLNVAGPASLHQLWNAHRNDKPVVMHTHTTGEDFQNSLRFSNMLAPLVDRYTTAVYNRADMLIAPSQYTADLLHSKPVDTPVTVVSNGVDTDRLDGYADREVGTEQFTAVNLGLVFERKGLTDFIKTGDILSDTQFTWYGPQLNKAFQSWRTNRKINNSPDNVSFPGYIQDIRDAFAEADVFFFPTHEENQGLSLLEAMYCETPVVVRDIPAFNWLTHEENCLKADTVDGFATAIQTLKNDPELRHKLAQNARKDVVEHHTLDTVGVQLKDTYEAALNNY